MKFKFHFDRIYTGMLIFAVVISALVCLILYAKLTPWKIVRVKSDEPAPFSPYEFRDLNHDGFSEGLEINNDFKRNAHYLLFFTCHGAIIDQFNIREPIFHQHIFYGDYTGDGYDECFLFTTSEDSVFLYGINIIEHDIFLNRQFIARIPKNHPFFKITQALLYDLNNDSNKELLFTLHPGVSLKSRGLYVYDLRKKKITKRFENSSSKDSFMLYDLDGDGKKEIILLGKANGNGKKHVPYSDYRNWVFILNEQLKLLFPPLPFGYYPSIIRGIPIQLHGQSYLLLAHFRAGVAFHQKPLGLYLINSKGRFVHQEFFGDANFYSVEMFVDNPANPKKIFISPVSNQLQIFDPDFNLVKRKTTTFRELRLILMRDIDRDGKAELITNSLEGTQIFDQDLNLLASINVHGDISFRQHGKDVPLQLNIHTIGFKNSYLFRVVKNPIIQWLPALILGLSILLFALLYISNIGATWLLTFLNYAMYSIKKTSSAAVLIKPNGHLFYFNARTQKLLNFREALKKNMHFQKAFNDYPDIINCINQSIKSGEPVQKDFVVNKRDLNVKGEILVIPFKTHFNYIYAYLLEIRDFTKAVLSDRHKTWAHTIQKIAHEIKTPLSSVLLNVERIQQKIQDSVPAANKNTAEDFEMALAEIRRIQEMTNQFLKFTRLEVSDVQPIQFKEILDDTLNIFKPYLNNGLQIELHLEQIPHTILADPKQLQMALQVFIENSIDALKGKGKILITTVLAENPENYFHDYLEIEIADNGPGIPPDLQDQVFEPFYTTKKDGTGMGLAIAKKIINDHGGNVEIVSKENFGVVFRISLPITKEAK